MKPSTKRGLLLLAALIFGYAVGFVDGSPWQLGLGPALVGTAVTVLVLGKLSAWLALKWKRGGNGPDSSGHGPFPQVPRPPGGRSPTLRAQQSLP